MQRQRSITIFSCTLHATVTVGFQDAKRHNKADLRPHLKCAILAAKAVFFNEPFWATLIRHNLLRQCSQTKAVVGGCKLTGKRIENTGLLTEKLIPNESSLAMITE